MNYREALAWLYGTQTFGIKLGLDNTRRLMAAAGNPHTRLQFIHVAGTNGKGSVCAMADSVLREAGMRCGLYTSPHLVDFRERIRVDGAMITEEEAASGLTLLREAAADWDHAPTFFELATVLAAWWFDRVAADIVVWETGMGGRLDATNVVTPLVSVITPVGLDHEKWLGDTLAAIAAEKAGIVKRGVPVVSAPQSQEVLDVIGAKAETERARLIVVEKPREGDVGLVGAHQKWNAALALAALDAANLVPDDGTRARGLAAAKWPARFQCIGEHLVVDGAHNVPAAHALVDAWRSRFGSTKARLVFGALEDKKPEELLAVLRAVSDEIVFVPVNNVRAAPVRQLKEAAATCGFSVIDEDTLAGVLAPAPVLPTLVTGSLFLAGEALALLGNLPAPPRTAQ